MNKVRTSLLLLLTSFLAGNAYAVTNTDLTATYLNPTNIGNEITAQTVMPVPKKKNKLNVQTQQNPTVVSSNQQAQFMLKSIVLTGTIMPIPPEVKALYQKALNQPIGLSGLQQLANQIQGVYRNLGYILIRVIIPPQEVSPTLGVVKLEVIEGQINRVIFTGDNPQGARSQLLRYANQMEDENPITYDTLQRFLTLANNLPGLNVSATLVPAKGVIGGANLIVNVEQQKQSAFMNFNNRGTPYVGPGQILAGASIYDILGADDLSLSGAMATSKASELTYVNAAYNIVVGPYGTDINPSIISTQTEPGGSLEPFELEGNSLLYNFAVNQPLIAEPTQNLTLQTEVSHLSSSSSAFQNFTLFDDSISTIMAGLNYQGLFWRSYNNITLSTTVGLPILGAPTNLANPSRVNGTNQFVMFNLNTATTHYLTPKISFVLASAFQVTPNPLLSSEQIGYGGAEFGQAYIPYIFSGDNGAMGAIALRYDIPTIKMIDLIQPQVFYDVGVVADNKSIAGSPNSASGSSAGIGLNVQIANVWQIGTTLAKSIKLNNVSNTTNANWQAFINLTGIF